MEGYRNGITSQRFRADLLGSADLERVDVIEITKLGEVRKEKTVAVSEFGDNNLLLVDEGHMGLGSEEETGWLKRREAISSRGFVFEYSATFAQAVAATGSESITQAYAKSVLFDYSCRYFYEDGFGKDYSILNLAKEGSDTRRYLTACSSHERQGCTASCDSRSEVYKQDSERSCEVRVVIVLNRTLRFR